MQWIVAIVSVYLGVAVLTTSAAIRYSLASRPRKHEPLERLERAVLAGTALLAGAFWLLLLPVFLPGWYRSRAPRWAAACRRVKEGGWRRGRAARHRAHRFFPPPGDPPAAAR